MILINLKNTMIAHKCSFQFVYCKRLLMVKFWPKKCSGKRANGNELFLSLPPPPSQIYLLSPNLK